MKTGFLLQGVVYSLSVAAFCLHSTVVAANCDPVPAGIVAWWQGENNAQDAVGGNNGILINDTGFTTGEVGTAFELNGANNYILVNPAAPSNLDVGQGTGLTFEEWIKPANLPAEQILFEYERVLGSYSGADVGVALAIHAAGAGGILYANLVDTNDTSHILALPTGLLASGVWQHIAMTYDKASGLAAFYVNGSAVTTENFGTFTPQTSFTNLTLGAHTFFGSESSPSVPYAGGLDEISLYNRALSSNEIAAIYQAGSAGKCQSPVPPTITEQPANESVPVGTTVTFAVTASGSPSIGYQWIFNGTNLDGATNPTLTLPNAQLSQAGSYSVLIANSFGSTNSATAVLSVYGVLPVITSQPGNQTVLLGTTASFSVSATGTVPLSYQWSFNGSEIIGATNATLSLADAQFSQSGNYSVLVTNPYGSTNSAAALLTVSALPTCTPVPSGIVAWWQGNDNAQDAIGGNNGVLMNGTGFTNGEVDTAFELNGNNNYILVNPSAPSNLDVGQGSGLTFEEWIKPANLPAEQILFEYERVLGSEDGADIGMALAIHAAGSGGILYANLVDTNDGSHILALPAGVLTSGNWQHIAMTYDKASGLAAFYVNGIVVTTENFGTFTPQTSFTNLTLGAHTFFGSESSPSVPYAGGLDEISLYNRALSSNEIAAIFQAGSAGKCQSAPVIVAQPASQAVLAGGTAAFGVVAGGMPPFTYQWNFNGTNLEGATNATLTLADVQFSAAGTYEVQVSNAEGATNSAGAALTILTPPFITQQPQSQSVFSFGSASFSVAASGTGLFTYQWELNGTNLVDDGNIIGSTTTNLTIGSVTMADVGGYQVVVTSPYATTNSAIAVLTVPETVVSLGSTGTVSGATITMPVIINALGNESAFAGSVNFDPTKLVLQSIVGATPNYTQTNGGYVGFAVFPTAGNTFNPGSNVVATLVFNTLPVTNNTVTSVTFGDTPVNRQVVDDVFEDLPATYQGGSVQLTPAEYEADVYPRFNGDHQLTLQDWMEEGRMVAGLDVPTNTDEFMRADCAPRNAPDGVLTVADWVQAGRYVMGLDPLTLVGPPGSPEFVAKATPKDGSNSGRVLQVATVSAQRGQTVTVPVSLVCVGNETAAGMSFSFNTNQLRLVSFLPGSALPGGSQWNANSNQVGKVGLALAAAVGNTFTPGTNQLAVLTFAAKANASGTAAITLDNSVVKLQTADLLAASLATTYVSGVVVLPSQPNLSATVAGGKLQFSWSLGAGTFQVQTASQPTGPWTTLALPLTTDGVNVTCGLTSTNQQQYYRLSGQ